MVSLVEQVARAMADHGLARDGARLVVAVSGGLDSMVLLHVLHRLAAGRGWRLVVAHLNHQLRGRASEADERLVRRTAERLGLRLLVGRADVGAFRRRHKVSVEMAARRLRHQFLARVARRVGAGTVALAHHADDQVELFFLRLLRGAGSEGLAGMSWSNPSPADPRVTLVRPLLGCTRKDLERFARQEGISFREDTSNASLEMLRNRIRHELLPLLRRRYQPALARTTLRVMSLLGAEAALVDQTARRWLGRPVRRAFARLPVAAQRRVIQLQLAGVVGEAGDFDLIEALRLRPGVPVTVAPGLALVREADGRVRRHRWPTQRFRTNRVRLGLSKGGACLFDGVRIAWRTEQCPAGRLVAMRKKVVAPAAELPAGGCESFDAKRVGRQVIVRHWRAGDRFQPIGMAQPVKLQDWFTNRKVPRLLRHELLVATTVRGEIFWVEGQRIGERFKLDRTSRRRLEWSWQRSRPAGEGKARLHPGRAGGSLSGQVETDG